jgi:general secretion pathway protein D
LQQDSDVNILSTPNLLTLDNQEAKIVVGSNVPFSKESTITTGGNQQFSVERKDVGITLKLTPHTTESDLVRLDIFQETSSLGPTILVGGITDRITDKRSIETSVMVKDRETVVIGGLITDDIKTSETKVPFLGDIPLLGYLFKSQTKNKVKRNLVLFLTPYIIRDADMLRELSQNNIERSDKFRKKFHFEEKRGYLLTPPTSPPPPAVN